MTSTTDGSASKPATPNAPATPATPDPFWAACRRVIDAHHARRADEARRLLGEARAAASAPGLGPDLTAKRETHLALLDSLLQRPPREPRPLPAASAATSGSVRALLQRIDSLERDKAALLQRVSTMPSIDPLCIVDPQQDVADTPPEDFGIIVFGFSRTVELQAVLESLKRQDALQYTEVWLDGHQGNQHTKQKVQKVIELVQAFPVKRLNTQNGNYGFRKMLLLGLASMSRRYRDVLVLEDDCFPTRHAVATFRAELDRIRDDPSIFSVYGHPFLVPDETTTCPRFQGWGWASTSDKLRPMLRQLMDCYAMNEAQYLEFVRLALTPEVRARIDVTPPRQPTKTLERFFAWDETLGLLAALNGQVHRPTPQRTIYNCGMGRDSTHFADSAAFRGPPFNLITPEEVWTHF